MLSLDGLEARARRQLPRFAFEFVAGGADDEATLRGNRAAFAARVLVPNVLRDVAERELGVTLFGRRHARHFGIAPMGGVNVCVRGGDVAMARGAAAAGIPFILSGAAFTPLEQVAADAKGLWFQPLLPPKLDDARPLLDRAGEAGVDALVLTADIPVPGRREADLRNGFGHPLRLSPRLVLQAAARPGWTWRSGRHFLRGTPPLPNVAPVSGGRPPPMVGLTFATIEALRAHWSGPLVIKGVLAPDDARRCIAAGADAVIVSNHGGRQLDTAIATLDALAATKQAVGAAPVMLDGGIRRGTDVVKALALGASFVWVGRPFLWATVVAGAAGVDTAAQLLADEIDRAFALCGCRTVADVKPVLVG